MFGLLGFFQLIFFAIASQDNASHVNEDLVPRGRDPDAERVIFSIKAYADDLCSQDMRTGDFDLPKKIGKKRKAVELWNGAAFFSGCYC